MEKTVDSIYAKPTLTVDLLNDLRVRAVVMSTDSETGLGTIDFDLKAEDGPYTLTLIKNPLIDYPSTMEACQRLTEQRAVFMQAHGTAIEPPDCSWQHIMSIWEVAHWYRVDEFADRMTVGMSVTAWNGTNRIHTIYR